MQSEYDKIEREYIDLLKRIGKSDKEIKNSIKKINESVQKLLKAKNDYSNKIKLWIELLMQGYLMIIISCLDSTKSLMI